MSSGASNVIHGERDEAKKAVKLKLDTSFDLIKLQKPLSGQRTTYRTLNRLHRDKSHLGRALLDAEIWLRHRFPLAAY